MARSKPRKPSGKPRRRRPPLGRRPQSSSGMRWVLLGVGIVVVAGVALLAITTNTDDDTESTDALAFDLPAIEGEGRIRLADFTGTPVVVNFFASWCTACDAELPGFSTISRQLEGQVTFVGVNSLETGDPLLMPERHNITQWPLARDTGGRNGSGPHAALGGRGMPITAFYDAEGNLLHLDLGALPEPLLRSRIASLYGLNA